MLMLDDTIAAIATPPGEGGIGIIRLSGRDSFSIASRLSQKDIHSLCRRSPHTMHYCRVLDPQTNEVIDDVMLLLYKQPHSYTGEDVAEICCHGGPLTLANTLTLCLREGARSAEPGEFTMRAFLNGKMDLAQAEAVCDQIRAKTETARKCAVLQRQGSLSVKINALNEELIGILAAIEVTLDFSEEVGDLDYALTENRLRSAINEVRNLIESGERGRLYREGIRIAIVGKPNVGKSSLLNAILRANRAIVTPIAGTTRDVLEESANLRGIPITAIDTAGLRETEDVVEKIGVERAHSALDSARFVLFVLDACDGCRKEDAYIASLLKGHKTVWILNKQDLLSPCELEELLADIRNYSGKAPVAPISAEKGSGLQEMEDLLYAIIMGEGGEVSEGTSISNARHIEALKEVEINLKNALDTSIQHLPPDFISIDIRAAMDNLGLITGGTATESVINRIFHDFCVGK
jgi:tRNA modification GTPase